MAEEARSLAPKRMAITRREILAGMAAVAAAGAQQKPQSLPTAPSQQPSGMPDAPRVPRPRTPPKPRTTPAVCLYSQHLIKVEYEAVGMVLRDLGFDGCDMAVVPGSHIAPEQAGSDLMRGIEAISGVGLEVPIISTPVISGNDPNGRQISGDRGLHGGGVVPARAIGGTATRPIWRPAWRKCSARCSAWRRSRARTTSRWRYTTGTGIRVGAGLWDMNGILRGIDPRWVGYDFDPGLCHGDCGCERSRGCDAPGDGEAESGDGARFHLE